MADRIEIKAQLTASEAGEITGIAWPFGTPDRVGDVIEKGAFDQPVALPMLFAHDQGQVIGVWDAITETPEGLNVKGRLLIDDVERAREVRAMIRAGAVSGLSIGFVTKDATRHAKGRTIKALALHEISVVAVPCHPDARIQTVKGGTPDPVKSETVSMENANPTQEVETKTAANDAAQIDAKALNAVLSRLDRLEAKGNRPGAPAIVQLQRAVRLALIAAPGVAEHIRPERIRAGIARPEDMPVIVMTPAEVHILGRASGGQVVAEASMKLHVWTAADQAAVAQQVTGAAMLALVDAPRADGFAFDAWDRPIMAWVPDPDPALACAHAVISLRAVLRWRQ